jgi:hypothetical protein
MEGDLKKLHAHAFYTGLNQKRPGAAADAPNEFASRQIAQRALQNQQFTARNPSSAGCVAGVLDKGAAHCGRNNYEFPAEVIS